MLPKILYAMLIGGLCSLFFTIVFNIPKLIRFIAKMLTKNKDEEKKEDDKRKTKEAIDNIKKCHEENLQEEMKNKGKNIFASSRIVVAISIILCITLYLLFLTTAFTNKRDTFICYVSNKDDSYHADYCLSLGSDVQETSVYEASRRYDSCSRCRPAQERFRTTITERNYIAPIFISVPISIAFFYLLTYRKKEE